MYLLISLQLILPQSTAIIQSRYTQEIFFPLISPFPSWRILDTAVPRAAGMAVGSGRDNYVMEEIGIGTEGGTREGKAVNGQRQTRL